MAGLTASSAEARAARYAKAQAKASYHSEHKACKALARRGDDPIKVVAPRRRGRSWRGSRNKTGPGHSPPSVPAAAAPVFLEQPETGRIC